MSKFPPVLPTKSSDSVRSDIRDRTDIEVIVHEFYARVREDELLGYIFDDVAKVDWTRHLPRIVDFWETALFRSGTYRGNPLQRHLLLSLRTDMSWNRFQRWLDLFFETIDRHYAGDRADHLKRLADDMARVISRRIESLKHDQ